MSRLGLKITRNGGFGNVLDQPRYNRLFGGGRVPGNASGIVIDGVIYPLECEPPIAQTHGWGIVPGQS
jgi:hypothetical protein